MHFSFFVPTTPSTSTISSTIYEMSIMKKWFSDTTVLSLLYAYLNEIDIASVQDYLEAPFNLMSSKKIWCPKRDLVPSQCACYSISVNIKLHFLPLDNKL